MGENSHSFRRDDKGETSLHHLQHGTQRCLWKEIYQGSLDLMSRRDRELKMESLVGDDETPQSNAT